MYASAVWDPYDVGDISKLEKVQRRAARWVLNDYGRFSSVSLMLDQLKWPTLQLFNFLRRNLSNCSPSVKATACLTIVRPVLVYAASVWDP